MLRTLVGMTRATAPMADDDHDEDIVRLAFAILDEESHLWPKTWHRGGAAEAEGVSGHKHSEGTS